MKRLGKLVTRFQKEKVQRFNTILDRLTFLHILLIWITIIALFGIFYFVAGTNASHLSSTISDVPAVTFLDHIYFSFITATSTGFGDIVPGGFFKVIAIVEVIFGLMLLAFVTSKLVSIKQDMILTEIYEISFKEKINRVRSSLLLFRQNLGKMSTGIEEKTIRKREIDDLYVYLSSFEEILHEIFPLIERSDNSHFTKTIEAIDTELIFNSILQSFEKVNELLNLLDINNLEWRRDATQTIIRKCVDVNNKLLNKLNSSGLVSEKIKNVLAQEWKRIVEQTEKELEKKAKK